MLLLKLDSLIEGQVVKRPSMYVKSPYVADIKCTETDTMLLAHTASLGCCGLSDVNANVLMTISKESKTKPKNQANLTITIIVDGSFIYENKNLLDCYTHINQVLNQTNLICTIMTKDYNLTY